MKNRHTSRFTVPLIGAALIALAGSHVVGAAPIKIGAILALSGNSGVQGQNIRDGLQLAVDDVNKRGGVNGSRIELIVEDSKTDPQTGVDCFTRIEAAKHPLFYLSYVSSVGLAIAPLAEEKHVMLVGLVTTALDFTRGRDWVFRYWPLGQAYIPPLLRMLQDLKVKKLGVLYQNDEFGKDQVALMNKAFSSAGGTVASQSIEMKDTDYRAKISALKDQEALYLACAGSILNGVLGQLKEANYRGHILTSAGATQPTRFGQPEYDGIYIAAPLIHNPTYLYAKEAGDAFEARYKKSFDLYSASGYDFIKLVTGLLEDREISRQGVKDLLTGGFEYSGVFGHLGVKPGEHDMTFLFYPTQVVNGSLKYR
jgi:branched-chain amino acid transport system substrate-binding protein